MSNSESSMPRLERQGHWRVRFNSSFAWWLIPLALGLAPALGMSDFAQSLLLEMMVFAVLAMSLDLLLGQTGLVSLGHAAFFAIGAYAAALSANYFCTDVLITSLIAVVAGAVLALPIGSLCIRLPGFYFLMITFAFSQMIFQVAFRWASLTGGSDGLLVSSPTLFGYPILASRFQLYITTLVIFVLCFILFDQIRKSSFGQILAGIRENTRRMRALGYNVRAYKLIAFTLSASVAALIGAIYVQFSLFVSPDTAHWAQSATVLVMVLIGGAGSAFGPVVGAAAILLLQHQLSSYTEHWNAILGFLFVAVIWVSPSGFSGLFRRVRARVRESNNGSH
jgi:branched-chain amino acid transport system permease protein